MKARNEPERCEAIEADGAEVVRRRLDAAAWAKPGPQRGGASKAVGVAGEGQRCRAVGGEARRACTADTHGPRG